MSKAIKVDDEVYGKLAGMLLPRETFSQAVGRLLVIAEGVDQFIQETTLLPEYRKMRIDRPGMARK